MDIVKIHFEDLEDEMQFSMLELGKDSSELKRIAKKHGIDPKSPSIAIFKGIYSKADVFNRNGCRLKRDQVASAIKTLANQPVDINHDAKYVVGTWLEAELLDNNDIVAYGTFYKYNFKKEYKEFLENLRTHSVGISFEAFGNRIKHSDDTYDLEDIYFCGGALLDKKTKPAVEGSKILEFAKIVELGTTLANCPSCLQQYDDAVLVSDFRGVKKCPHCQFELTAPIEFSKEVPIACPKCKASNWMEVEKSLGQYQCAGCLDVYEIEIDEQDNISLDSDFAICHSVTVRCPQCAKTSTVGITSDISKLQLSCNKCSLQWEYSIERPEKIRKCKKITNITAKIAKANELVTATADTSDNIDSSHIEKENKEDAMIDRLKDGIRKLALEIKNYREDVKQFADYEKELAMVKEVASSKEVELVNSREAEIAKINESHAAELAMVRANADKEIAMIKENAAKIVSRRQELAEFASELNDDDLLNDLKYENASLKKQLSQKSKEVASAVNVEKLEIGSGIKDVEDTEVAFQKRVKKIADNM